MMNKTRYETRKKKKKKKNRFKNTSKRLLFIFKKNEFRNF